MTKILGSYMYGGEEYYMYGSVKRVIVNADNAYVSLGKMNADTVIIGKKVKNVRLEHIQCNNIVLNNPETKVQIEGDGIDAKKLTAVITKNIKCKKSSKKYIYSWKPIKTEGKKYSVQYIVRGRKDNGRFVKIKMQKKNSIKLNKKRKLRIEVRITYRG